MRVENLTIADTETVRSALSKMDLNQLGIVMIVDGEKRVKGIATDGDIRTKLLAGNTLESLITDCYNTNFIWADIHTPREQLLKKLDSRIKAIPILDENRRFVSIVSRDEIPIQEEERVYARSRAPVRISFGGGGSDLTHYFKDDKGAVINTTISLYSHATLRLRDDQKILIKSRDLGGEIEFENYDTLADFEGKFRLIQAVIKVARPSFGFELYLHSDFPMSSGLGGSAVVAAAILGCFNEFRQDKWDQHEIAELAFQAERLHLRISGGWQDQYASVFGGFNFMEFQMEQNIVHPLRIPPDILIELEESLILCDTGTTHDSGDIHDDQRVQMQKDDIHKRVQSNVELTYQMRNHLLRGRLLEFGQLLHEAWQIKRGLGGKITNPLLDEIYAGARNNGAVGGKLLGAGGGGFFLFYVTPYSKYALLDWLTKRGLNYRPFLFDSNGLQSWTVREKRNYLNPGLL